MRCLVALSALFLCIACGWLARPARWEVDGLSMAPGLMPGDVAGTGPFPLLARWRSPQRFERWTLAAPDGALAIKRVWGLPGEEFEIVAGDLVIAGKAVVKPPHVLAEVALPVAAATRHETAGAVRLMLSDPVFDDVPFAPGERRVLVPVHDMGVASVIDVGEDDPAGAPACVEIGVGARAVRVAFHRAGRHVVVAGRLDGAFVAAAWPLSPSVCPRSCLPSGWPVVWTIQSPWNGHDTVSSLDVQVVASASRATGATILDVTAWRDVHHRPSASGTMQWRLGGEEWFVLGDFPGGSRDSRQWGPVGNDRFRDRLTTSCR
jgi:type IV secretory pathway protease TraF